MRTSDTSQSGSPSTSAPPGKPLPRGRAEPSALREGEPPRPSLLLLFLDGVGIGPSDPEVNPFLRADLPALRGVLGDRIPTLDAPEIRGPGGESFPLDAALGISGTPQSGTGQVALLTGENAPALLGRHFGPWTPVRLRPLLEETNLLRRALAGGARAAFANAYPSGYPGTRSSRRVAAPPLAARSAGLLDRHEDALARGRAVASEIVNDRWRAHLPDRGLPDLTPEEAGGNLARIVGRADLTLFAHYDTDHAGHRGGMAGAIAALERVDRFLSGLLAELPREALVLVVSDHGNLEDVRGGHTRNPALGLAIGSRPPELSLPGRITEVADYALAAALRGTSSGRMG